MECEVVMSIVQRNAGLPFTFCPYEFIKESMFFIISRYISYLEANRVKTYNVFITGIIMCEW